MFSEVGEMTKVYMYVVHFLVGSSTCVIMAVSYYKIWKTVRHYSAGLHNMGEIRSGIANAAGGGGAGPGSKNNAKVQKSISYSKYPLATTANGKIINKSHG